MQHYLCKVRFQVIKECGSSWDITWEKRLFQIDTSKKTPPEWAAEDEGFDEIEVATSF
jgi:hypothetical protein